MLTLKSIQTTENSTQKGIDFFIAACGYEGRAIASAQEFSSGAKKKLALGFTSQRVLEYQTNADWFVEAGFELASVNDSEFRNFIDLYLKENNFDKQVISIEIDVSCFNRFRLAHLVDALRCIPKREVFVTFRYSIAIFTPPLEDTAPTVTVEPVIPQFAGWTTRPDRPPAAIVGLGYEPNKAIGIVDHLEINNATWAFYPIGPIPEYRQQVLEANQSLIDIIQADGRYQPYDLAEPSHLFHEMNSLIGALKSHFNVVLIPFGPKLFALVTLLLATLHDEIGVWRVSSGSLEAPVDRKSSGHFVSVCTVYSADEAIAM